jgi:hypothetical protein
MTACRSRHDERLSRRESARRWNVERLKLEATREGPAPVNHALSDSSIPTFRDNGEVLPARPPEEASTCRSTWVLPPRGARFLHFVRRLHCYYDEVRLLVSVSFGSSASRRGPPYSRSMRRRRPEQSSVFRWEVRYDDQLPIYCQRRADHLRVL